MERFDDWVTDPAVTLEEVRAFVDDPATIHQRFRGKYRVITSSGQGAVTVNSLLRRCDQMLLFSLTRLGAFAAFRFPHHAGSPWIAA
jgi:hypothetical protein